jgi:hypothetical protein
MPYKDKKDLFAAHQRYRDEKHANMWDILKQSSCMDCKNSDPRVLEFDHRPDEEKSFGIAKAISSGTRSWKSIFNEMSKCDIVCSNCHKIRTMERGNYKRYQSYSNNNQ